MNQKRTATMKKFKFLLILMLGMASAFPASAQTSEMNWVTNLQNLDSSQATLLVIMGVVLFVIVLLLILMIYLMSFMVAVFKKENPALSAQPSWWDEFKLKYIVGNMRPVGGKEEKEMMLDHSYDGIVELDNHMPPWLVNVFYITIAFAVVYFTYYSVLGLGQTQLEEYAEEQRVAAIKIEAYKATLANLIDENTVEFDESAAALAAGKSIFSANCAACHAADGGGGVGPNFTDEYWIHGGSINDIFRIVKYGVPAKGMIPWQDQLSPEEMQQVSSYIKTLVGTTPANPKAPEGELYKPADEKEAEAVSDEAIAEAT